MLSFYNFFTNLVGKLHLLLLLVFLLVVSSCRITRNVPSDQYLLDNATVNIITENQKPEINKSELDRYVRQKPNKRVLLFRFHLRLYNMAKPGREKGLSRMLRTIGEEPVLLDTFQTKLTAANLQRYLESKGFYSSVVRDTTKLDNKRASVTYEVIPGQPLRVRNINYVIEDTVIGKIVLNDTLNSIIKKGSRLDMDLLRGERKRIESLLKVDGFFFFSHDFISFDADTSVGNRQVDLDFVIRNRFIRNEFGDRIPQIYRRYEISNVYVYTNYDPVDMFYLQEAKLLDTVILENQKFIYSLSPGIRFKTISNANLIRPDQIYSESLVKKTRDNLNSLRLFRAVNVFFRPDETSKLEQEGPDSFLFFNSGSTDGSPKVGKLNCYIQLTPHTLQSYQVDLVGTNTASDIGMEGNLSFQHKNLFNGAEVFDTKLRSMIQFISGEGFSNSSIELGGSVGISFPRFLSPVAGQEYTNRYSPRTQLTSSYNYQRRPEYTRTLAGLSFGYSWRSENRYTHSFTPAELNIINLFKISDVFLGQISGTYLENSYKNAFVTLSSYGFVYTNQTSAKSNFSVLRYNIEVSGNTLNGIYSAMGIEPVEGSYQIFNTSFSQFVRSDINYVYNQKIDVNNTFVYRVYAGAGLPYGNSKALPFEKKYFSGGSTGVRAWNARGLGPGTYVDPSTYDESRKTFTNQTADIKIEANVEYRFALFWMLEGALFLDAGNIWAITSADERPGSVFFFNKFYRQLALGTGTGIRMNLGFFTLRFDLGMKLYDPGIKLPTADNPSEFFENIHWIPFNKRYVFRDDFVFHFGIGYPF